MKNYTYGWNLREQGYTEIPESEYTERQKEMKEYIQMLFPLNSLKNFLQKA